MLMHCLADMVRNFARWRSAEGWLLQNLPFYSYSSLGKIS
jgi:hypothetical protein